MRSQAEVPGEEGERTPSLFHLLRSPCSGGEGELDPCILSEQRFRELFLKGRLEVSLSPTTCPWGCEEAETASPLPSSCLDSLWAGAGSGLESAHLCLGRSSDLSSNICSPALPSRHLIPQPLQISWGRPSHSLKVGCVERAVGLEAFLGRGHSHYSAGNLALVPQGGRHPFQPPASWPGRAGCGTYGLLCPLASGGVLRKGRRLGSLLPRGSLQAALSALLLSLATPHFC